ncbi:S-layer homology domain-containing protein [Oscillibacter sp. ER4]|uniref:S-layer homology domain-containing protein n=1 Tax=Oscillibacter sp. ER4 TaxID=1519439 RepID=UPI00051B3374|nr:S-layer homology domain-containing protein [Oscillibacter sp. ER4]
MRKRKNTGRLLSILLCLVMVLGTLPITAQAEELGKVPGSSDTNTYEKADIKVEISVVKHVQQTGTETPPAETFEFEVEDTARDEKHPLSYYGIGVEELKLSTNDGVGDVEKTFSFKVSWTNDYADYHWDAVPKSGTNTVAWYSKTFLLREKNDGKPGWNYSNKEYALTFWYDIEDRTMQLNIHDPGNDAYYPKAEFTNTYNGTRYELPFTKTVKLGGNTAPGRETFELEIFGVGVRYMEEHAKDLYTAVVTTNGAGDYDGALVISGPADQVRDLVCEGFYVREKNAGAANWTYDDAVWHILRERTDAEGDYIIVDTDAPLVNNLPADTQPETEANEHRLVIHATTWEESDNGGRYADSEALADKMTFTNTYTRSTSGGGGGSTGAAITANKTDAQGKALAGATFVLEDSRGREAYQATSNTSGTVRFTDVSSGTYTLLEKKAPEGYVLSNETYTLTVSGSRVTMNGKAYSPVTFVNRKAAELNRTDHFAFLVGYTDGTFGPERNMTRAEVTTMFARLLTEQIEADKTYSNTFSDVPKGCWAANYIGYMQQFGIITGYSDGSFRPDAPVTRAEFAAIASRFEKLTEGSKSFTDVPDTYWAARYINFAATRGWVTGYSDGTFKPENTITRAEVAAVTCRLLERSADQSYIRSHLKELRTFSDVTESHWAYWYAMEAANGHDYTKSGGSENWNRTYR